MNIYISNLHNLIETPVRPWDIIDSTIDGTDQDESADLNLDLYEEQEDMRVLIDRYVDPIDPNMLVDVDVNGDEYE